MSYITFDQVCKDYGQGEQVVHAADHVSFGIEQGELCVVLGPSGAGKTTILNLLGGPPPGATSRPNTPGWMWALWFSFKTRLPASRPWKMWSLPSRCVPGR